MRLACGFLSIKVSAVFLGPAGVALVGQLTNFTTLLQGTLGNAINSAVIKTTAEAGDDDPVRVNAIIGTALRLVVAISLIVAGILILGRSALAEWLLSDNSFSYVLFVLAFVFPATMLGQLQVALFTARRRFELVSITNIGATVISALIFVASAWLFGIRGALVGIALGYPLTLIMALYLARGDRNSRLLERWPNASRQYVRPVVSFYPMLLMNSVSLPLGLLLVRDALIESFGAPSAGLWQATVRLSDMYTMVFIVTLSMYALPTLSAARDDAVFRVVLRRLVTICLAVTGAAALLMYVLRDLVVRVVFTQEFVAVRDLWPWQLVGDVFLVASWPMRSALMARGRQIAYVAVEASIGLSLFVLTKLLMPSLSLKAANVAHALTWTAIFGVLLWLNRRALFTR
jgi:PST family polysaccharide transporter